MKYNHKKIEKKWQHFWEKKKLFEVKEDPKVPGEKRRYVLDMFPYPSAQGLHVGHPEGYTASDIISRYFKMRGFSVLHPIGFDAFGLPAENYAIKHKVHPRKSTEKNIKKMREQIKSLGFSYDWSREVITSHPDYYRWTQWLFLQFYKNGLAYRQEAPVNWCPSCQTVLAREQVVDGRCERCQSLVRQKELKQWFLKITAYQEKLLADLEKIDWPEKIKLMQKNWLGKSEGIEISFKGIVEQDRAGKLEVKEYDLPVFTTRPDTIYGVTYLVLAPEHPLIKELCVKSYESKIKKYQEETNKKTELERIALEKEKTGAPTGVSAINPLTGEKIPIWIADYVMLSYGTGAVMGVPGHDQRDFEFAKKYGLEIREVIAPTELHKGIHTLDKAYEEEGVLINSDEFSGLTSPDARNKITDFIVAKKLGRRQTNWRLRDWLISRQRYWGTPIPIIYCEQCGEIPVPEEDLPIELPDDAKFMPTGESPLAKSKKFHKAKCPGCGQPARRESDTMDTFVCSSWYFLRYCDSKNKKQFASKDKLDYWLPVDLYIGGAEHAVMHLLYARFFWKAIRDFGVVSKGLGPEPFLKLRNQGLILGEDGQKMSKSRGNIINPDEIIKQYGADTMRMYEMFMGPFDEAKPWSTKGIIGIRRFLERVWKLQSVVSLRGSASDRSNPGRKHAKSSEIATPTTCHSRESGNLVGARDDNLERLLHKTIKKVTEDIEEMKFNTAISQIMILVNEMQKQNFMLHDSYFTLLKLLAPFAPHISEELWERTQKVTRGYRRLQKVTEGYRRLQEVGGFLSDQPWPKWNPELVKDEEIELVIQINGKVRDRVKVSADISEAKAQKLALDSENIKKHLAGQKPKKIIFVKGRLVNVVV